MGLPQKIRIIPMIPYIPFRSIQPSMGGVPKNDGTPLSLDGLVDGLFHGKSHRKLKNDDWGGPLF